MNPEYPQDKKKSSERKQEYTDTLVNQLGALISISDFGRIEDTLHFAEKERIEIDLVGAVKSVCIQVFSTMQNHDLCDTYKGIANWSATKNIPMPFNDPEVLNAMNEYCLKNLGFGYGARVKLFLKYLQKNKVVLPVADLLDRGLNRAMSLGRGTSLRSVVALSEKEGIRLDMTTPERKIALDAGVIGNLRDGHAAEAKGLITSAKKIGITTDILDQRIIDAAIDGLIKLLQKLHMGSGFLDLADQQIKFIKQNKMPFDGNAPDFVKGIMQALEAAEEKSPRFQQGILAVFNPRTMILGFLESHKIGFKKK